MTTKLLTAKEYRARALGYYERATARRRVYVDYILAMQGFRFVERALAALMPGRQRKNDAAWQRMKLKAHQAAARTVGR